MGLQKIASLVKVGRAARNVMIPEIVPSISKLSQALPDCTLVMEVVSYSRKTHAYDLLSGKGVDLERHKCI